ncbi:MAG TPA: hypothetical protein VFX19_08030, partial [Dehalococcoidia bacterium]|nr:hypothetical protein [Dehalococcoidia bacterium]
FFLMQSSNFMSHSTCAMYTLLSLLFILKRDRPLPYGFLAGAFFGLAINTHTLDVVVLIPPFGLLLLSYLRERDERHAVILHIGGFVAGALLLGVAMGLFTHALTGKFFGAAYAQGDTSELLGFKNGHTLDIGIRNEQSQLIALLLVFNGWPAFVGLAFVLLPFLLGTRNPWDWFCLACALLPILVYILYRYSGVYEGPRYWFEAVPFLIFLTARGAEIAAVRLNEAVSRFNALLARASPGGAGYGRGQAGVSRTYPRRVSTGFIPAYALVLVLFVIGSGGWLFNKNDPQDLALVPYQANAIRGVFDVDDRLARLADETDLHNALVLVKPCGVFSSIHCYGTVFIRNNITFDGDVVWMRYEEGRVDEAIAAFPGREVYIANWDPEASLEVYDPSVNR